MYLWNKFVFNIRLRRFTVLLFIIAMLFIFHKMISMILLTFIFSFLIIRLINFIQKFINIPSFMIVIMLYLLLIVFILIVGNIYIPKIIYQFKNIVHSSLYFYNHLSAKNDKIILYIINYLKQSDFLHNIQGEMDFLINYAKKAGTMGITFFLSLALSFFLTLEKNIVFRFSHIFLNGPYSWFFQDIYYFARIFVNTFGVILETQFLIAIINTILTCIGLKLIHIYQIASLGFIIFILSLIPVAGVIISSIPISFVAYIDGGVHYIVLVVIMLLTIHILESYVLSPKFMSARTKLPIFYTFMILLVSERLLGLWGLIVGIPIFIFFLNVLGIYPTKLCLEKSQKERFEKDD